MAVCDQLCRKDRVPMMAQIIKKSGLGTICGDLHRIIVYNFNRSCGLAVLGNLGRFFTELQGSLYVLCLHFLSIVEFYTFS